MYDYMETNKKPEYKYEYWRGGDTPVKQLKDKANKWLMDKTGASAALAIYRRRPTKPDPWAPYNVKDWCPASYRIFSTMFEIALIPLWILQLAYLPFFYTIHKPAVARKESEKVYNEKLLAFNLEQEAIEKAKVLEEEKNKIEIGSMIRLKIETKSYFEKYGRDTAYKQGALTRSEQCSECNGKGTIPHSNGTVSFDTKYIGCQKCSGTGIVSVLGVPATNEDIAGYETETNEVESRIKEIASIIANKIDEEIVLFSVRTTAARNGSYENYVQALLMLDGSFGARRSRNYVGSTNSFAKIDLKSLDAFLMEFDFDTELNIQNPEIFYWKQSFIESNGAIQYKNQYYYWIERKYKKGYGLLVALEDTLKKMEKDIGKEP